MTDTHFEYLQLQHETQQYFLVEGYEPKPRPFPKDKKGNTVYVTSVIAAINKAKSDGTITLINF
jgi:hypothetical protein